MGRLEHRHDSADEKVYKVKVIRPDASLGLAVQSKALATVSISFYYQFFQPAMRRAKKGDRPG